MRGRLGTGRAPAGRRTLHADLEREPTRCLILLRGGPKVQRVITVAGLLHVLPFASAEGATE